MVRNQPCLFCKQRRRKCERDHSSKSCKRCLDKNLRCSLLDPSIKDCHFNHSRFDDIPTTTVVSLYEDVISLEKQIRQLDLELKQQQQKALVEKEPSWTINVKDGKFQLATTIKTLEEFLLYGKSVIKYLSPFGNTFQTTHLEFKQTCPSLVKVAIQAASNFYQHQDGETAPQYALISYKPTRQPSDIYEKLIDNYFNCFNDAIPILHEPSYRTHLKNLIDPLEDPVTLAICTESSILTCKHSILDPTEKRYFGEFFYKRATHILTDIFDDPDRALESLLVISLLRMFLITTLRFEECKKWGAISVALCCSLHQEFGDFTNGGPHLPWGTRVKLALLHRNYAISQCYIDVSNFFNNSRTDTSRFFTQAKFGILPDESPKVQGILQMINHIHGLSLHPAFVLVVTQSKVKSIGGNARLYFEEIIRYEETVLEWWHKLPESFKICSDPLSLTSSIIDRTTDPKKLLMASYFYIFTLSTQALLVQPNYKENIDSLNQIIKERGVHFAMYSAKMSFQLAKRLEVLDVQCYSPHKLLICSIDSLMAVIQLHTDESIKAQVDEELNKYLYELRKNILPDNLVPTVSPFNILSSVPPGKLPSLGELYKNYPLPGEALLFDLIQTTVDQTREFARTHSV